MRTTVDIVEYYSTHSPEKSAIRSANVAWTYRQLYDAVETLAQALTRANVRVLALAADNGPTWIVADLAAQRARVTLVPLPPFFSTEQTRHALADGGADGVLTDGAHARTFLGLCSEPQGPLAMPSRLELIKLPRASGTSRLPRTPGASQLPLATAKVSYTSGTTGNPKGVCLTQTSLDTVAQSLWAATADLGLARHLCLLPLATLLENIAGVYAPLRNGAEIAVPTLPEIGWTGSTGLDVTRLVACIAEHRAHSVILLPQMLAAIVDALEAGAPRPDCLRFAAVGGAHVPAALLERAAQLGLPVYEGYGLTECASVVALSTPAAQRRGSVGRVLPHAAVRIDERGEIRVSGPATSCYVGDAGVDDDDEIATGDLGRIDADGYLYVTGRRKAIFITSFGRNVSPDWVEAELTRAPPIAQAALFGEARPWNVAVVVPSRADTTARDIQCAVDAVNADLPDYARAHDWIRADEPFTPVNGLLTANGRNRRTAVWNHYRTRVDACYYESLAG